MKFGNLANITSIVLSKKEFKAIQNGELTSMTHDDKIYCVSRVGTHTDLQNRSHHARRS
jgi:hypothetical protein